MKFFFDTLCLSVYNVEMRAKTIYKSNFIVSNVILADFMYFQNLPVVTVWIVKTNITQFYEYFQNVHASVKFFHLFELEECTVSCGNTRVNRKMGKKLLTLGNFYLLFIYDTKLKIENVHDLKQSNCPYFESVFFPYLSPGNKYIILIPCISSRSCGIKICSVLLSSTWNNPFYHRKIQFSATMDWWKGPVQITWSPA
jgi:hypothetical protein